MPSISSVYPHTALPGGEFTLTGKGLDPPLSAAISGVRALATLARGTEARLQVSEETPSGSLIVRVGDGESAPFPVHIASAIAESLHPVSNPVVDAFGNIYTTLSGARGQQTPVSVFRLEPARRGGGYDLRPFVREILNPTGLAFSPAGDLFVSSRADGIVYRIDAAARAVPFVEGLGIATGIAFDSAGALYVGDRSGTIFKITIQKSAEGPPTTETFVFATLEPAAAAYHLAFDSADTLYLTGPSTVSSQGIYAIDGKGDARLFYRGLGRPQGMALDRDGNLFVAASLRGDRGIVRITPQGAASLVVSGPNLVGLCLLPEGKAALATRDTVYEVDLGL